MRSPLASQTRHRLNVRSRICASINVHKEEMYLPSILVRKLYIFLRSICHLICMVCTYTVSILHSISRYLLRSRGSID
jgi:hypothetical protein